ncbi:hypothetical protein A7P54_13780 [Acinetobacter sp. Ac_3412]|uniref:hypothetical protein n=1 Tax=Acinetobacter sp. Ac_3412 TaxID=1848935 RepID=UPI00148FD961|nr:hypothetical protein [Acinetobacter sp. Ac_3412]NNP77483.1 hypothetical protein [Acinetobacter sp. Ac_3412]
MNNKFANFCIISLCLTQLSHAEATPFKMYQSEPLHCGEATFQVISSCFDPDEGALRGSGGVMRESCQSSHLLVSWKGQQKQIDFPIATAEQAQQLKSKGYTLQKVIRQGDWSPQSLACGQVKGISGYFVVVNQATTNDLNQEYLGKGSLSEEPVLLNLNGSMTSDVLRQKIYPLLKQDKVKITKVVSANALFGDE